jgi:hypothetical protein
VSLVNLQITVANSRIARVITNLRRSADPSAVASAVSLDSETNEAKRFLVSIFPRSEGFASRSPGSRRETVRLGVKGHLGDGWRVKKVITANGVGFALVHANNDKPRIRTILDALNRGTREGSFTVPETIRFKGAKSGVENILMASRAKGKQWTQLFEGQQIYFSGTKGSRYVERTFAYIVANLLGRIKGKINTAVTKLYNQGS